MSFPFDPPSSEVGPLRRRLAAIFDAIDDAVIATDSSGRITDWNAGAERLYGWSAEEVRGQPLESVLPARSITPAPIAVTQELALDRAWTGRHLFTRRDGVTVEVDAVVRGLLDPLTGALEGRVAVHRPRKVASDLDAHLLRAERLSGLGTLAGGVAHEFNNLLATILSHTSYLTVQLSEPATSEVGQALAAIQEAAQRGADLTKQMLTFARGRASEHVGADVGQVLRSVQQLVAPARGGLVKVSLVAPPERLRAQVDASHLKQALVNLALNARDAMGGQGTISITVEALPDTLRFLVDDTGPGVPLALRPQIFDPFYTTKPPGEGTGLGLAVVHTLVERWRGTIEVADAPGGGARFILTVPRGKAVHRRSQIQTPVPGARPARVLVVDDDASVRAGTARLLRLASVEAVTAESGEEGLERIRTGGIDLVVLDVVMPGLSGDEVYRRLRVTHPTLPVLFVSGFPSDRLDALLQADPCTSFLGKPFDLLTLAGEIQRLYRDARMHSAPPR